jgi:predicted metalloprotease
MKALIFLFSLWLICPPQTDTYYIIKVSGNIINSTTGTSLSQGDEIMSVDEIQFGDKDVYALVMSDKGDRLKVQFTGTGPDESGLYKGIVKNSISKSNKKRIKTRSFITNADIKNLKEFLGDDQFTVIGNSLDVQLSKEVFVDNSVLAQYEKNGQRIDKELVDQNYKLNLSRTNLGAKPVGETKIYHVDFFQKSDQIGTQKITRLDFNFIDAPALKDEMSTIIGVYTKKGFDKTAMKNYLMEYFVDFYGNTHLYTLSEFVDKIVAENMK